MFGLFLNDVLKDFWANNPKDIFIEVTCEKLRINKDQVDLVWYEGLFEVPKHYEFDASKNLVIKKEVVRTVDVITHDEQGNEVVTQQEVTELELDRVVQGEVFFTKGLMVKPC